MGLLIAGHIHRATGSAGVVSLSGTSGSPNVSTDQEQTPTDALAGWQFINDGAVKRIVSDVYVIFNSGVEWIDVYDGNNWIRATLDAGDAPNFNSAALNSWLQLTSTRQWQWRENSDPPNEATTAGTLKIEISSSGSGSPILDTGYYRGVATQFGTA